MSDKRAGQVLHSFADLGKAIGCESAIAATNAGFPGRQRRLQLLGS